MEIIKINRYVLDVLMGPPYDHIVLLYNKERGLFCRLYFKDQVSGLNISKSGAIYNVTLDNSKFASIVDILRNEKPVYFHYYETNALIKTQKEPVGEEEGLSVT